MTVFIHRTVVPTKIPAPTAIGSDRRPRRPTAVTTIPVPQANTNRSPSDVMTRTYATSSRPWSGVCAVILSRPGDWDLRHRGGVGRPQSRTRPRVDSHRRPGPFESCAPERPTARSQAHDSPRAHRHDRPDVRHDRASPGEFVGGADKAAAASTLRHRPLDQAGWAATAVWLPVAAMHFSTASRTTSSSTSRARSPRW